MDADSAQPKTNPWLIAIAVILPTFIEVLDTTVVSVALPTIAGNLSATVSQATWIQTGYLISNAIVLPASAWFSSFFGRKRFFMACVEMFRNYYSNAAILGTGWIVFLGAAFLAWAVLKYLKKTNRLVTADKKQSDQKGRPVKTVL
jgi:MFS family permease